MYHLSIYLFKLFQQHGSEIQTQFFHIPILSNLLSKVDFFSNLVKKLDHSSHEKPSNFHEKIQLPVNQNLNTFPHILNYSMPPFSRFRKSFPTSCENQGSTYIKIVSPIVCTQAPFWHNKSEWLLLIAGNSCVLHVKDLDASDSGKKNIKWGK